MFVIERLSHALARGQPCIYAEVLRSTKMGADAHDVTAVDADARPRWPICSLQCGAPRRAAGPAKSGYVNAHGTGTQQNDQLREPRPSAARRGSAADGVWVSSTKAILGHLINAAGSVELAVTDPGPARRLCPAHDEPHRSRPGVQPGLHPVGRPAAAFSACVESFRGLRRAPGRGCLAPWPRSASGFAYPEAERAVA